MDQDTVVIEQIEDGKRLIESLIVAGFEVRVAFWAKPTDEGRWFLYLASPFVDEGGPAAAYDLVFKVLRDGADLWIDPFEIKVIGMKDSLTEAALAAIKPRVLEGPFAVRNPRPYRGMTRFNGSTFGGLDIDGAHIYPPSQTTAST